MAAWLAPLAGRLDFLSLFVVGQCSKDSQLTAATELRARVRRGQFVVQPLVDGTYETRILHRDEATVDDSETESIHEYPEGRDVLHEMEEVDEGVDVYWVTRYDRQPPIALVPRRDGALCVPDGANGAFEWRGEFDHIPGGDGRVFGPKLKVYWKPVAEDGVDSHERGVLLFDVDIAEATRSGEHVSDDPSRAHSLRYVIGQDENDFAPRCARVVELRVKIRLLVWVAVCEELEKHVKAKKSYWRRFHARRPTSAYEKYIESLSTDLVM